MELGSLGGACADLAETGCGRVAKLWTWEDLDWHEKEPSGAGRFVPCLPGGRAAGALGRLQVGALGASWISCHFWEMVFWGTRVCVISLSRLSVFKFLKVIHGDEQWLVGCGDLLRRNVVGLRGHAWRL